MAPAVEQSGSLSTSAEGACETSRVLTDDRRARKRSISRRTSRNPAGMSVASGKLVDHRQQSTADFPVTRRHSAFDQFVHGLNDRLPILLDTFAILDSCERIL